MARYTARPGHTYTVGRTRRTVSHPDGPLLHAATSHHVGRSIRSNFAALCGAGIVRSDDVFDPAHPRACSDCARAIDEANAL